MKFTILGSGGCAVIPKPLCGCPVCREAKEKGGRYRRTGPSAFLHDENLLIDTPAEIAWQVNRCPISKIEYLLFSHFDPDHTEGFRVVEQIALDFRTWEGCDAKRIRLLLPEQLYDRIGRIQSIYGPMIDYFEQQGFVEKERFRNKTRIGGTRVTAVDINRGDQVSFVYVFERDGKKLVYAPCDIKPFPESSAAVRNPDLLVIQPGIFETGLRHGFEYPADHISRRTLYTFQETLSLADRLGAKQVLFVHLEEYWNRSYDDYVKLENRSNRFRFAYDGMCLGI